MRLRPGVDALDFAASVHDLLARACDSGSLRAAWDSDDGRLPGLWERLARVGVPGLLVPEQYGGAGMDLVAAVPVAFECGRAALPEPVVPTLAGTSALAAAGGAIADEWLARVAAGGAVVAVAHSDEAGEVLVAGGRWADVFVVAAADRPLAVGRDAVEVIDAEALDRGAGLVSLSLRPGAGTALEPNAAAAAVDAGAVLAAAELVGLAQAMLDMAVRYALQREQFGKPIGSFQAVKHHLADVYVAAAFALPVVHRAAWSVSHGLPSAARDTSHAKLAAAAAAERAARTALQVHGGIGYTYEHDLHIWMKRTWTLASLWGTASWHRARVAAAVLSGSPPPRVP